MNIINDYAVEMNSINNHVAEMNSINVAEMPIIDDHVAEINNINVAAPTIKVQTISSTLLDALSNLPLSISVTPTVSPILEIPSRTGGKWISKYIIILLTILFLVFISSFISRNVFGERSLLEVLLIVYYVSPLGSRRRSCFILLLPPLSKSKRLRNYLLRFLYKPRALS